MLVTVANREDPGQTASDLGLLYLCVSLWQITDLNLRTSILAHRIRISEILPWDRKSYLIHAILPRLSHEGFHTKVVLELMYIVVK